MDQAALASGLNAANPCVKSCLWGKISNNRSANLAVGSKDFEAVGYGECEMKGVMRCHYAQMACTSHLAFEALDILRGFKLYLVRALRAHGRRAGSQAYLPVYAKLQKQTYASDLPRRNAALKGHLPHPAMLKPPI